MRKGYIFFYILFGLVLNSAEVKASSPRECKSDWEVSAFDILKMSDKALLDMFCDTDTKFNYNMEELKKIIYRGSEATKRSFRKEIDNCKYLHNKLAAGIEGRLKRGIYFDLKCFK